MHRTTARFAVPILLAALAALAALVISVAAPGGTLAADGGETAARAAPMADGVRSAPDGSATAPSTTIPGPSTVPPVTANEFLPENADLTTCIGAVERPGCGNENRGGWHQLLVFGVLAAALVVVFTRIAVGVRRSRRPALGAVPPDEEQPSREQPDGEQPVREQPDGEQPVREQPDGEQTSA